MNSHLKSVYLRQIKEECEFCLAAVQQMNLILKEQSKGDFFREALDLVHHSAAISRILWPPGCRDKAKKKRSQRRGQALRDELNIKNGHVIQNRTLRDHFEHFDERLDDWAENSKHKNIISTLFGPRNAVQGDSIDDTDIIHHYDPETKKYAFRGEEFDIQELVDGIDDIYNKVSNCLTIHS
ncbi:hypothetical protein NDJ14_23325 [Vibrio alginolyticus]|uniref:hypothetical protein n=1 Tax=Vibrio alginolyticus TaxID=663 RepID=UPI00215DD66B|nr:hypothetical protein [Vibrio alginolyticus]MCS0129228.1 hypothetical protein [Vibrio alginolyticus]MCS0159875.1 hypothetical protein [Vibrio alginolyticus]